jgi:hypothetical protein
MTEKYVIQILAPVGVMLNGGPAPAGSYVKSYSADGHEGLGDLEITMVASEALRFPTPAEAWRAWRQQSTVRPLRRDGRANRPLTAYTVSVEPIDVAAPPQ